MAQKSVSGIVWCWVEGEGDSFLGSLKFQVGDVKLELWESKNEEQFRLPGWGPYGILCRSSEGWTCFRIIVGGQAS